MYFKMGFGLRGCFIVLLIAANIVHYASKLIT